MTNIWGCPLGQAPLRAKVRLAAVLAGMVLVAGTILGAAVALTTAGDDPQPNPSPSPTGPNLFGDRP